jgi:transcriptional repressor NrdR
MPWVVKKDGRREPWSRDKVLHGLHLACRKRGVDAAGIQAAALAVEQRLMSRPEVTTAQVGEAVMAVLRSLDPVAYVRFASVYGAFESIEQFAEVISSFDEPNFPPEPPAPTIDIAVEEW